MKYLIQVRPQLGWINATDWFCCRKLQFPKQSLVFMISGSRGLLKTWSKKEKMLVTSIFSFSHNIFYPIKDRNQHFWYIHFVL